MSFKVYAGDQENRTSLSIFHISNNKDHKGAENSPLFCVGDYYGERTEPCAIYL